MPKRAKNQTAHPTAVKDLVTVAFAEDMDLAKQYTQLLAEHEISATIKRLPQMAQNGLSDIAILVPESLLDEAHTLISEQASHDDFFDMMFDQNPDADEYGRNEDPYDNYDYNDDDF